MNAGNGNQAHIKALLCLVELSRYGFILGLGKLHRVLCTENVEIGQRRADHEILFNHPVLGFCLFYNPVRLFQPDEAVPPVDGLYHVN